MREVLYQWTQLAVSRSTSARPLQACVRSGCSMSSVLYRPIADSMSALSSASPTLPIDGAIPASMSAWVKLIAVYWLPVSEWWTRPRRGEPGVVTAAGEQGLLERGHDQR